MTSDIEGALSFIEKTNLKPMVSQRLRSDAIPFYEYDHTYSAAVIAATEVAFSSNVSRQQKIDVENSCLFAQFAANAQYNHITDAENFYNAYALTLREIGWTTQDFNFDTDTVDNSVISCARLILNKLDSFKGPFPKVHQAVDGLNTLDDNDPAFIIYSSHTHSNQNNTFQLGYAYESFGDVIFDVVATHYDSSNTTTRVLFTDNNSGVSINLRYALQSMIMNESVFSQIRPAVEERLGDNAKHFVAKVPLLSPC